jgi:uncharacterized RDD family membrane protein YckC
MPEVRLVSGEAVDLDIRLARAGSRALALMIDIVLQFVLFYILLIPASLLLGLFPLTDAALVYATYIMLVVVVIVGYPTVLHAVLRGRTIGKLALGLRVVRADGGPISWRHSFTRALVGAALEWPGAFFAVSWIVSLTIISGSARAQRLADMAAGTIVIHERSPESWGWVPSTPGPLVAWAATLDLTNVDDGLALAARHFLARSRSLAEPYRSRLGEALARELLAPRHASRRHPTHPAGPTSRPWSANGTAGQAERLQRNRAVQAKLWPELFPIAPAAPALRPAVPAPRTAYPAGDGGLIRPRPPTDTRRPARDPRGLTVSAEPPTDIGV